MFFLSFVSCERDDICAEATATTPRLSIEFYDINDPDTKKLVPTLSIYKDGLEALPILSSSETIIFNANTTTTNLPLKTGTENVQTVTRYVLEKETNLRLNDDDTTESNRDILDISYTPKFVYVSRACGYKSIFTNLNVSIENDTNPWINSIEITATTVENENTIHVRIFH